MLSSGGKKKTLLKQEFRMLSVLPSSAVSTVLQGEREARWTPCALRPREGGRGPPRAGGSLPASFRAASSLPWGRASQMWAWAATSCWQSSSWLPALSPRTKCAWAPHRSAPAEHRRDGMDGTWQPPEDTCVSVLNSPRASLVHKRVQGVHAPFSSPLPFSPPGHSLPAAFLGRKHPS